jgi:hypothetical protein
MVLAGTMQVMKEKMYPEVIHPRKVERSLLVKRLLDG